jgi:hypothetical protein
LLLVDDCLFEGHPQGKYFPLGKNNSYELMRSAIAVTVSPTSRS